LPASGSGSGLSNEELTRRVREIDNVRAAIDWSFSSAGDSTLGVELTAAYAPVWLDLWLMGECRERCARALQEIEPDTTFDARLRMWLQINLAISLFDTMGSAGQARHLLIAALETAETLMISMGKRGYCRALSPITFFGLSTARRALQQSGLGG